MPTESGPACANTRGQPVSRLLARARSARRKGATEQAEAIYHDILLRYPGNRAARSALLDLSRPTGGNRLGPILKLYENRRYRDALDAVTAFLDDDPDNTEALNLQAACYRMTGQPEPALDIYRRLLDDRPQDDTLWQKCGATLMDMMRLQEAAECLEMATRLAPQSALNWMTLAHCHHRRGEYTRAYEALTQTLGRDPGNSAALDQLGQVLRDLGRIDLAIAAHERALAAAATTMERSAAYTSLGVARSAQGDKPAARSNYRRAMRSYPRNVQALLNLARLSDDPGDADLTDRLRAMLEDPGLTPLSRSQAHFALFSLLDRAGAEPGEAFDHLKTGNDLRRQVIRYAPQAQEAIFTYIRKLSERTAPNHDTGPGARPVFIVGMPRSGTTLTEQMLSAAPGTFAAGELTITECLALDLIRDLQQRKRANLTPSEMGEFATALRTRLTATAGQAPVIIDKMPLNFRWAGLILAALPDARIIHIERDPLETCWSNYKTSYSSHGNGFAYGLTDLAHYHGLYRDLTQHWRERFPDRFHSLPYESLVADTEATMRGLVEFCDLDWSDDCLHPDRAGRAVLTASAHQVRRPVYDGNRGDWRKYTGFLTPLIDGLPPCNGDESFREPRQPQ